MLKNIPMIILNLSRDKVERKNLMDSREFLMQQNLEKKILRWVVKFNGRFS